jgi:Ca2+/Na+ antiporter
MGLAWSAYLSTTNESISFINDGIQYQFPLLFATILVKYIFLALNGYKTSKRLFWTNLGVYLVYMLFIILIDYRSSLF